jgi:hypothetical protein
MVKCGVFFAVRTEFFNIICTRFGFRRLGYPSVRVKGLNLTTINLNYDDLFVSEFRSEYLPNKVSIARQRFEFSV